MTNEPKRSRRILARILRPKFSLRTLLAVMFVAALASAWWSQRARVQQEVCRELTKRGISWELAKEVPWYWRWLPDRVLKLGEGHWFRPLSSVSYAPNSPTQQEDDLVLIARLPQVDHLYLSWHGDPSGVEAVRAQLAPLSASRGVDTIHLNPFSMAMSDPPLSLSTLLFEALPSMRHLKRLVITRATLSVEGMRSLARFPNLVGLDLSDVVIDPAGVRYLASLTNLEELDLSRQFVGDVELDHLQSLRRLKKLNLDSNAITNAGLAKIAVLTTLTELDLGSNLISDIRPLAPLRQLKKLDLRDTPVTDATLATVENWPQLEELRLASTLITPDVAPHLLRAKNLKRLDLEECDVDDAAVASLLQTLRLETLNIEKTRVSTSILAEINRCRSLKRAEIDHLDFALPDVLKLKAKLSVDEGFGSQFRQGLGHFDPSLPGGLDTSLNLHSMSHVAGNLTPLTGNKTLNSLYLMGTDITDDDLKVVGSMTALTLLHLQETEITDAGLAHLKALPNLATFDLSETKITRDGLPHLAGLQSLTYLRLGGLDLIKGEADAWPVMPSIVQLDISRSQLSSERPLPLAAFPNLKTLDSYHSDVPGGALREVSQLSKLRTLRLGTVVQPDLLVKALEGNTNLFDLHFKADQLSAESFAVMRSLPALDFASLDLNSLSVEQLRLLAGHPSLRVFECKRASWNPEFLPIVASLPNIARFCVGEVDLDQRHLALFRGQPLTTGKSIAWECKFGLLPERPHRFAFLSTGNAVETIDLGGVTLSDEDLHDISIASHVKSLRLGSCTIPDTAGKHIVAMPELVDLALDRVKISPQWLADLKKRGNLKKLKLTGTEITSEMVAHLLEMNQLEDLDLSNSTVSDAAVAKLLTLPTLNKLNLRGTPITNAAFTNAAQTSVLTYLNAQDTAVTPDLVTLLHGHRWLQWLQLDGLSFRQKECAHYLRNQPLSEMDSLNISQGLLAITPDGGLSKHTFIRDLTLTATRRVGELLQLAEKHRPGMQSFQIVDEDLSADDLEQLPALARYVYFKNCRFSHDAFSKLPASSIRHFRFIRCPPIAADLTGLSRLPYLELVMFEEGSTVTSEQLMQLTKCNRLSDVRLGESQVSEEAILQLLALPTIRSVTAYPECPLALERKKRIRQERPWLKIE